MLRYQILFNCTTFLMEIPLCWNSWNSYWYLPLGIKTYPPYIPNLIILKTWATVKKNILGWNSHTFHMNFISSNMLNVYNICNDERYIHILWMRECFARYKLTFQCHVLEKVMLISYKFYQSVTKFLMIFPDWQRV